MLKIYTFLDRSKGISFAVEQLSELLSIPERTLYDYLDELAKEDMIQVTDQDGKKVYGINVFTASLDGLERLYSATAEAPEIQKFGPTVPVPANVLPETIHSTRIDEIVSSYMFLRKIDKEGGTDKIREILKNANPISLWEETKSELKSDDKLLALYPWADEHEMDSIQFSANSFITEYNPLPEKELNGVFIGTDGSLNRMDLVFQIFQIPTMMNMVFTSAAAVKIAIKNGEKVKIDPNYEIKKIPNYPLYSAEDYVEDLGTAYPHLSEGQRAMIAYTMMDVVHFGLDRDVASTAFHGLEDKYEQNMHPVIFRDGRIIPSNIHPLDFQGLYPRANHPEDRQHTLRAKKTWDALVKCIEVRDMIERNDLLYTGVVKMPMKPYFALMIDKIVSDEFGIPRGQIRNDQIAMSMVLKPGESSCAVNVNPSKIYLGPSARTSAESVLQWDFKTYEKYLEQLAHWAFYLNSRGYVCRYEFFDGRRSLEPTIKMLSRYALTLASPSPRGKVTSLYSPKRNEIVPSVIEVADSQANDWGKKVGSMLENHIIGALRGAIKR